MEYFLPDVLIVFDWLAIFPVLVSHPYLNARINASVTFIGLAQRVEWLSL
jgi:hypothetical protein